MSDLVPIKNKVVIWEGTLKWPTTVYDINGPEQANLSAIQIFKDLKSRGLLFEPSRPTHSADDLIGLSDEIYATLPKSLKDIVDSHREQVQHEQDSYDTERLFYEAAMGYVEGTKEFDPQRLTGSPWGLFTMFRGKHNTSASLIFTLSEYTHYAYEDEAAARV